MVSTASRIRTGTRLSMAGVRCAAIPWDGSADDAVRTAWEQLLSRLPAAPIYLYPEWTELERTAGAVKPWRVLVVSRQDVPLALIPLRMRAPGVAAIIDDFCPDTPPLLIDPDAEEMAWAALGDWLREQSAVRMLILGRYTDGRRLARSQQILCGCGVVPRLDQVMPNVTITLPNSWDEYLTGLGSRTRAELRRLERQMRRDYPDATLEMITDPRSGEEALTELIALHRRRWRGELCGSIFDKPSQAHYYRQVVHWALQRQMAMIGVLRIDGRLVAASTVFHVPGQRELDCHFLACDREAVASRRFSPGIVLFTHIARWAIDHQINHMGMGFGDSAYKQLLGGIVHERWEYSIARAPRDITISRMALALTHYLGRMPLYLRYGWRRMIYQRDRSAGNV